MPHDVTDLQQQVGVNPPSLKEFVHVLSGVTQLGSQPGNGAALLAQLRFDKMSDVRFFLHGCVFYTPTTPVGKPKGGTASFVYHT